MWLGQAKLILLFNPTTLWLIFGHVAFELKHTVNIFRGVSIFPCPYIPSKPHMWSSCGSCLTTIVNTIIAQLSSAKLRISCSCYTEYLPLMILITKRRSFFPLFSLFTVYENISKFGRLGAGTGFLEVNITKVPSVNGCLVANEAQFDNV